MDVLQEGIGDLVGVPLGTVSVVVSFVVLLLWIPLRQRVGIGIICNAVIVGLMIDAVVWALPETQATPARWGLLAGGLLLMGIGSGLYIGAGLGAGLRDGLMTGIHALGRGWLRLIRTVIELSVLAAGWALGGTVGIGTVLAAVGHRPPRAVLAAPLRPRPPGHRPPATGRTGSVAVLVTPSPSVTGWA